MHILWLKTELLHPVDKGGRIRTYHMLRALARRHEITYLCLDDGSAAGDARERAAEYATRTVTVPFDPPGRGSPRFYLALLRNLGSSLPYAVARYHSPSFRGAIAEHARDVDLVVCDFLAPAVNLPADIPVPTVLFQHNVEAEIWRRHSEVAKRWVTRWYFEMQWNRMARFEQEICGRVSSVVAVSDADSRHFRDKYRASRVHTVPTGVDLEYFTPADRGRHAASPRLVFTGSMDWMPNDDGMCFFLDDIWPSLRQHHPSIELTVVGRNPSAALRERAARDAAITVTGRVEDVRPFVAEADVFIVPLRVGGGTRLKIFEAMAMGCPVVSTTIGAEGLPLEPGRHLLIGDDPGDFAQACHSLLSDREAAQGLAKRAESHVRAQFGWDAAARFFADACMATAPAGVPTPLSAPAGSTPS